ncbi:DNA oxidative demethylase ALKBH2 [Amyelois transitella]|uniref:DNA oxidative demethylase ALKBH2 n=1 Tax=Amyelois transitella TaxID=680683 RepID=UPI00067B60B0|nr:DNA oxidative demethylase ALKBH2 [Amyelois transitella]
MDKVQKINCKAITWKKIKKNGLDLDYAVVIPRQIASELFQELEDTLEYFTGDLNIIKVFGKAYNIPRKHVAYGDPGVTYTYSGITVPALPWPEPVLALREFLVDLKGLKYNFVLVNRYKNGRDHMGEHRDNEPELDPDYPIASISLGQERDFVLKHKDSRRPGQQKVFIPPVKILLEHGSILLMNPPTNEIWYHSLPLRKSVHGPRINLTFRKIRPK